jgi:Cytochrome c7 and related cytochrome c
VTNPILLLLLAAFTLHAGEGIGQPLPFSHKQHAGTLKVACKLCHPNPNPGERMTIAGASLCMSCHSAIKTDSPAIQKLAQYAKEDRPIPWVRVYEIPSYVNFSHRTHLESKNACEDCHGKVVERDELWKQGDISMGGCMNCHRAKKVSIDCTFCHDQR